MSREGIKPYCFTQTHYPLQSHALSHGEQEGGGHGISRLDSETKQKNLRLASKLNGFKESRLMTTISTTANLNQELDICLERKNCGAVFSRQFSHAVANTCDQNMYRFIGILAKDRRRSMKWILQTIKNCRCCL